ncbi:12642_t:CDS:2, partial [Cetraspora pellucida]
MALFFYLFICLIVSTQSQSVLRAATIVENGPVSPANVITYPNDTVVVKLSYNLTCPNNNITIIPLRFIFSNMTLIIADIAYTIPSINYCPTNQTNTTLSDKIDIFTLPDNFLLIRYWNVPNDSPNMVQYYGLILSITGDIINRNTPVVLSDPISITNATVSNSQITTLDFGQKGILFASSFDTTTITWTRFTWDSNRQALNNVSQNVITAPTNYRIDDFKTFITIDGGYGLVYAVRLQNQDILIPSTSIHPTTITVFLTILNSDSRNFSTPVIIYQSTLTETTISISECQSNSGGRPGCVCYIHGQSTPESLTPGVNFWQMISFLAAGTVVSSVDLPNNFVTGGDVITYNITYSLHNDGILMLGRNQNGTLRGSVYNNNGVYVQDWGLPQSRGMLTSYTDNTNTVWAIAPSINNSWTVYSTVLPSLLPR